MPCSFSSQSRSSGLVPVTRAKCLSVCVSTGIFSCLSIRLNSKQGSGENGARRILDEREPFSRNERGFASGVGEGILDSPYPREKQRQESPLSTPADYVGYADLDSHSFQPCRSGFIAP